MKKPTTQEEFIKQMTDDFGARKEDGSKEMTMLDLKHWIDQKDIPFMLINGIENGKEYWVVRRV